jgi:peptide/nickel transport system permease protein
MLFPGIALLLTVLAFNLVGDAMQDALNPRSKRG